MSIPRTAICLSATFLIALCCTSAWAQEAATQPVGGIISAAQGTAAQQDVADKPAATTEMACAPTTAEAPSCWPPGVLMRGLDQCGAGKPLEYLGFRLWGFTEAGFTGRLTGGQNPLPARLFDARRPNNVTLNQLRLTLDRPYDSNKPVDVGGRVDGLFGGDAMLTHSVGLLQNAGEGEGDAWTDLTQLYGQVWLKTGQQSGLELTVGKFVTPFGYEVIDAPGNPLYSHSDLFNFAIPFTHTGVKANYIFNSQASAYLGIVEGWDEWEEDNNAHSYMAGTALNSADKKTSFYFNVITGPEQPDNSSNFRTVVDGTLTHAWTDRFSETVNADWGTEQDVPDIGSAHWYGVAHYFTYVFNDYVSGTWRLEWFDDPEGARTGTAASYYESTWGVSINPCPHDKLLQYLTIRPEFRWDFAGEDTHPYGDDHSNQLTAAVDVIYRF